MLRKINYYWRLIATGFCFAIFSGTGLILTCFLFPIYNIFWRDQEKRNSLAQRSIHFFFIIFMNLMKGLGILRKNTSGTEKLNSAETYVIVANHPTLIDVVFMLSMIPEVDCIIKKDLYDSFFLGGVVRAAGYIRNEKPETMLESCVESLQKGKSIVIFPEGTRSLNGVELRKFQRGAAVMAMQSGRKILPITITCNPATLCKGQKWYQIPERRFEISMTVGETINPEPFKEENRNEIIASKKLNKHLRKYFISQLEQEHEPGK